MTRFLALAALVTSSVAAAAAPAARQPTGKWIVNFADAQCIATRNYGTVESPLQLVLKVPPLGDVLQIGIVRNGQLNEARQLDGEIVFHDTVRVRTNVLEYGVRSLGQRALLINLPAQNLDRLRAASIIRI